MMLLVTWASRILDEESGPILEMTLSKRSKILWMIDVTPTRVVRLLQTFESNCLF